MTPCLSPDELIDLTDGVLAADRRAHVAACRRCRETAEDVAAALAALAPGDVPEPSPYFWTALNRRVQAAIAAEAPARGWTARLVWRAVVPLAGIALVLAALTAAIDRRPDDPPAIVAEAPAPAPPGSAAVPGGDDALALVMALADTLPGADADAEAEELALAPLPDLGDVAAAALTADELRALEALLREAVDRPTS